MKSRPLRADAARNRAQILDAARRLFTEQGIDAQMDDIAAAAGVGVGTVYRHFQTKEALQEAVLEGLLSPMVDAAREGLDEPDPGEALFAFIRRATLRVEADFALLGAFKEADYDLEATLAPHKRQMMEAVSALTERAQRAGAVRDDISGPEILALLGATCQGARQAAGNDDVRARLVEVVIDGLRAAPVSAGR
ncbi:MAG: helix-turn-helix domain-containing protein [Thermoleophilia bacterium]